MTDSADRPYDLMVFGATGFTGALVARYLAEAAPPNVRWAIAGRNREKLAQLQAQLIARHPRCTTVGCVVASLDDASTLQRMAASTGVLLNTAGPFMLNGFAVVRACVDASTDYIDLTGEAGFVRQIEASLAGEAARKGVRLVPCCGFEAIVADLGVLYTVDRLSVDAPVEVRGYVQVSGQLSGGSLQTALNAMGDLATSRLPRPDAGSGRRVRDLRPSFGRDPILNGWVAPMQMIDQDIVLRSAAALPRYGKDFGYAHHIVFPSLAKMLVIAGSMILMVVSAQFAATRRWMQRRLRQAGEGPSQEVIERGWFKVRFDAHCGNQRVTTQVSGGDPGYGETAKMFAQAGLCLAEDHDLPRLGGLLTPAQAMGQMLIARLQQAGIRFETLQPGR